MDFLLDSNIKCENKLPLGPIYPTTTYQMEPFPSHITSPLRGADKQSFAYITLRDRLPVILTRVIDALARAGQNSNSPPTAIISALSRLKYELCRDHKIKPFTGKDNHQWNLLLQDLAKTNSDSWYAAPWLFSETAMVRHT